MRAVVAGPEDHGFVQFATPLQRVDDTSHLLVDEGEVPVVPGADGMDDLVAAAVVGVDQVRDLAGVVEAQPRVVGGLGVEFTWKGVPQRQIHLLVGSGAAGRRIPGIVRTVEGDPQEPGLPQLASLDDLECARPDVVVDVPRLVPRPVVDVRHGRLHTHPEIVVPHEPPLGQKRGVVVLLPGGAEVALPVGRDPALEAAERLVVGEAEVEFADRRRLIAPRGQFLHEHRARVRNPAADVLPLPVRVRILSGDPGVARGDADGGRRKVASKNGALATEPIQRRHFQETVTDRGHVQPALIVGRDQEDVRPLAGVPRCAGLLRCVGCVRLRTPGDLGRAPRQRERQRAQSGPLNEGPSRTPHAGIMGCRSTAGQRNVYPA